MTRLIASFFYTGLLKPAPGTWGSAAAVVVGTLLHVLGGPVLLVPATIVVFAVGWWATRVETARGGDADPGWIVIDEVAGQWIALWPVSIGAAHAGAPVLALWPGLLTAFLAFRLFDIWKPGPVGWADALHGPTGVMLDDVAAGLLAAVVVVIGAGVTHGLLGL